MMGSGQTRTRCTAQTSSEEEMHALADSLFAASQRAHITETKKKIAGFGLVLYSSRRLNMYSLSHHRGCQYSGSNQS